jgi:lipoprotein NlpD
MPPQAESSIDPVVIKPVNSPNPVITGKEESKPSTQSTAPISQAMVENSEEVATFIWPAAGSVVAIFDDVKNKGTDIAGKLGDPVSAAADGRVVYAGSGLRGYGNLVIVKHANNYLTAYAHNQLLLVKEDQLVKRGQKIAEMGNSDSDTVKLHFEIRMQGKPIDPVKLLPPR